MEDDFALRYARIYQGVNSRAELVTLAPGLRPERRFAPLAREKSVYTISHSPNPFYLPFDPACAVAKSSYTAGRKRPWYNL